MAATYKLTYFNLTGLGEAIRLIFNYGKVDFEDNRIVHNDQWPEIKSTLNLPYGQMPILEYEGKVTHQSVAICRFAAKQAKLVGSNDWEDLEIDAAVDTLNDLRLKIGQYHYEKEEEVKEKKKVALFEEIIPFYIGKLEEQIKNNNGYLAVGKLTWADFFFVGFLQYINHCLGKDLVEDAPGLRRLNEKVCAIPQIKAYLDNRPKVEF